MAKKFIFNIKEFSLFRFESRITNNQAPKALPLNPPASNNINWKVCLKWVFKLITWGARIYMFIQGWDSGEIDAMAQSFPFLKKYLP